MSDELNEAYRQANIFAFRAGLAAGMLWRVRQTAQAGEVVGGKLLEDIDKFLAQVQVERNIHETKTGPVGTV